MSDEVKLEEAEILELVQFQEKLNSLTVELGSLYYQRNLIKKQIQKISEVIENTENDISSSVEKLKQKYGEGEVNLVTREFTPVIK